MCISFQYRTELITRRNYSTSILLHSLPSLQSNSSSEDKSNLSALHSENLIATYHAFTNWKFISRSDEFVRKFAATILTSGELMSSTSFHLT